MSERKELADVIHKYINVQSCPNELHEAILDWHERNREKHPVWCEHMTWSEKESGYVCVCYGGRYLSVVWQFCPECGAKRP